MACCVVFRPRKTVAPGRQGAARNEVFRHRFAHNDSVYAYTVTGKEGYHFITLIDVLALFPDESRATTLIS